MTYLEYLLLTPASLSVLLVTLGIFLFITILIIFLLPFGHGPGHVTTTSKLPRVKDENFIKLLKDSLMLSVENGGTIEILNNGDAFMESLLKEIDSAETSINFMVYIWKPGKMSEAIIRKLYEKLKQGVEVRIVLDAFGGYSAPKKYFDEMVRLGAKVSVFHSLSILPWKLSHLPKRNHRRSIVIDGKRGYIGGMAVYDKWLGNARNKDEWRDVMFKVHGRMVPHVQGAFAELWAGITGEILTGDKFYPDIQTDERDLIYIPLSSTPSPDLSQLQKFVMLSILAAEKSIYITTPYFLMEPSFCKALIDKAKQGVDIKVILPNKNNDSKIVRHASQYLYENFLRSGIRIFEYQISLVHSKYMMVDGIWSIIGSANMDNLSRKFNNENIFGIYNAGFTGRLHEMFEDDLKGCKEIEPERWYKRGPLKKWKESICKSLLERI